MTDEPASLVEPWIIANKVTHPVVILPDGKLEDVIGVDGFPTGAVFLGDQLKWTGYPDNGRSTLGKMRKQASKTPLVPKKLSKIVKAIVAGDQVKALNMLRAKLGKYKGREADWGKRFDSYMLKNSERAFAAATAAIKDGYWMKASMLAEPFMGKDSQFPGCEAATAAFDELAKEPMFAKEMAGGKLFAEAQDFESEDEFLDAFKAYKAILKKCPDTLIADRARDAANVLMDERKPGYNNNCTTCRSNKGAACAKHLEKVKL